MSRRSTSASSTPSRRATRPRPPTSPAPTSTPQAPPCSPTTTPLTETPMPKNPQQQSRQVPSPRQIFELLKFKKLNFDATDRRLQSALTIADLRLIAKRRTPKAAFDYTDGAAEQELSLARARQAFEDVEFSPSILRPAADVDTSSTILGGP